MTFIFISLLALASPADQGPTKKVVLMPLSNNGVDAEIVDTVEGMIATAMSDGDSFEVVSAADLRAMMALESTKAAAGCGDDSCMAELATALGADLIAHGSLGKLGDTVILNLNLFDAHASKALRRETVEAENLTVLSKKLAPAVHRLVGQNKAEGGTVAGADNVDSVADAPPLMLYGGGAAAAVGVAAIGVGAFLLVSDNGVIEDPKSAGSAKSEALARHPLDVTCIAVGAAVVVAGGALIAMGLSE